MSKYYFEQQKVRVEIDKAFRKAKEYSDKLKPKQLLIYDLKLHYAVANKTVEEAIKEAENKYPAVEYHTNESWNHYCEVMGEE